MATDQMHPGMTDEQRRELPTSLAATLRFFFGFTSPRVLLISTLAGLGLRLSLGGWSASDFLLAGGIIALWPLQEWLIHVFILHFQPFQLFGHTIDLMDAREHRKHHRDPWNPQLVFIPVATLIYTSAALWVGTYFLAPTPQLGATFLAVYLALSLHYEWAHYLAHSRYVTKSEHYRRIVRNHRLHHFKNEHYWQGVSMLSADRLLRTAPEPRDVPISDTVRSLGIQSDAF